jgi:hypothetical protein
MKKLSLISILAVIIFYTSCDNCRNYDCPVGVRFSFKVLDETGKNLAESSNLIRPYTSDSIQVFSLSQNALTKIDLSQDGSTLSFPLNDNSIKDYIVRYSFAKDDTLSFDMTGSNDECCGSIVNTYSPTINGMQKPAYAYGTNYVFVKITDCNFKELVTKQLESEYGCNDTRYDLDIDLSENYMIIRSQLEFESQSYGSCRVEIDFTKYDLVIGKKQLTNGNTSVVYNLKQDCSNRLKLQVTFNQDLTDIAPNITYHTLVPKLGDNQTVDVDLVINGLDN